MRHSYLRYTPTKLITSDLVYRFAVAKGLLETEHKYEHNPHNSYNCVESLRKCIAANKMEKVEPTRKEMDARLALCIAADLALMEARRLSDAGLFGDQTMTDFADKLLTLAGLDPKRWHLPA